MAERTRILRRRLHTTFASLRNPNFRMYFAAQIASNIGNWIQITAENWLVLQLTPASGGGLGRGLALGITNALQFGPLVFFGLYGGVISDRFDRRRLLITTQCLSALLAAAMGILVATHLIRLWMIWLGALLLGLIICVDRPGQSSLIKDLVGDADLPNAVALNHAVISSGRMIGPAVSGLLIAYFGIAPSFLINAVSFAMVILVLTTLDVSRLHAARPVERGPGQVRQGLSYIRHDPVLRLTVTTMSVIFIAAYNFQVMVPLAAARMLDGSSQSLGIAMSCLGLGAVAGSLIIASRVKPGLMMIAVGCGLLSFVHIWLSLSSTVYFSVAGIFLLGVSCGIFNVAVSGTLQVTARDEVRGRVMSTYSIGILGSALIGAPLFGRLADSIGVSGTFLIIAVICAGTALAISWAWILNFSSCPRKRAPRANAWDTALDSRFRGNDK